MANVIVIGSGNVGGELARQLRSRGHEIVAQAGRTLVRLPGLPGQQICEPGDIDEVTRALEPVIAKADAAMLAIPTVNGGQVELKYMSLFLSHNLPVITSAKGALAYHYPVLRPCIDRIGYAATVGGGTDILEVLRRRELGDEDGTIYVVINGTLNYVWSAIQAGGSFSAAIADAKALGYAEPNNDNPIEIVNGELRDVCMKAAILYNISLSSGTSCISPVDFEVVPLGADDIPRLTSRNARYRFIVTCSSLLDQDEVSYGSPGSIAATCGRWRITGGFHDVRAESPWFDWLRQIDGVNNGFTIHRALGRDTGHSLTGPGAGPETTAAAMIRDLHRLVHK